MTKNMFKLDIPERNKTKMKKIKKMKDRMEEINARLPRIKPEVDKIIEASNIVNREIQDKENVANVLSMDNEDPYLEELRAKRVEIQKKGQELNIEQKDIKLEYETLKKSVAKIEKEVEVKYFLELNVLLWHLRLDAYTNNIDHIDQIKQVKKLLNQPKYGSFYSLVDTKRVIPSLMTLK